MRFFSINPDGGDKSNVIGLFLVEIKPLFSIVLLKFKKGNSERFHNHSFNAISFFIKGNAIEHFLDGSSRIFKGICFPKFTSRNHIHRYEAHEDTYALTFRGPWNKVWFEIKDNKKTTMTHGRKVVKEENYL